jgi:hypothetical protein
MQKQSLTLVYVHKLNPSLVYAHKNKPLKTKLKLGLCSKEIRLT